MEILPDGGNVLFLSGPPGNSQGMGEAEGLHEVLDPTGKYTFIGEQPFEVTNWDPAETQQVLTAAIAKNPEIDVIVSDFGPSLVGALPEFEKSGRSIPRDRHLRRQRPRLLLGGEQGRQPGLQAVHRRDRNDHVRLAMQYAVARATGRRGPRRRRVPATAFEDSVSGDPEPGAVRAGPAGRHLPVRGDGRRGAGRAPGVDRIRRRCAGRGSSLPRGRATASRTSTLDKSKDHVVTERRTAPVAVDAADDGPVRHLQVLRRAWPR